MHPAHTPEQGRPPATPEAPEPKEAYLAMAERLALSGAESATGEQDELGGISATFTRWLLERRLLEPDAERLTPPARAARELLSQHRQRLREAAEGLSRDAHALEDVLSLLMVPRLESREAVDVEYYTDRVRTRQRLDDLNAVIREELVAMRNSLPGTELLESSLAGDLAMKADGIDLRLLTSQQAMRRQSSGRYVKALTEAGIEVRVAPTLPLHMNIVDRAIVVIGVGPGPQGEGGDIILHSFRVAQCFHQVFSHAWDLASPYAPHQGGPNHRSGYELSPQEREVLTLLATGAKDETIARRLGCSDRTLRRLMTQIMEKLGASSRFEAGVTAGRLGLVG